jgi:uncharacterized protein (DUF1810 family)
MIQDFDLERFVVAQDNGAAYERACRELRDGRKSSHWMWFVFPQIAGLGTSATSRHFAISSIEEARAYLSHPVLGPRLLACAQILLGIADKGAAQIFGELDAQKLCSSMTLFQRAQPAEAVFQCVLDKYFDGVADVSTESLL